MNRLTFVATAVPTVLSGAAQAHTGLALGGAAAGVVHPLVGLDHLLAMLGVGIWAAHVATRDRRALWLVPAAFVAVMALGAMLAMAGLRLPLIETGVLGSVLLLGVILLAAPSPPLWLPMIVVGLFALVHGQAHGTEMPEAASPLAYAAGFIATTAVVHTLGVGIGMLARRWSASAGTRTLGGLVALGGLVLAAVS